MGTVVIVTFQPNPGQEDAWEALTKEHEKVMREEGLVTDRPFIELKAEDGARVEIFEWASVEASESANSNDRVQEVWNAMFAIGAFPPGKDLAAFETPFAHFTVVDD